MGMKMSKVKRKAKEVVEESKKAESKTKVQLCKEEVEATLEKYGCKLDISLMISTKLDQPMFNVDFVEVKGD